MRSAVMVVVALALARPAAAEPTDARVLTVPTAWLPRSEEVDATLGLDHRGDGAAIVDLGLGELAGLELGTDSDVRACTDCSVPASPVALGRAAFRIGARTDAGPGSHAIALGVRTTFAARGHSVHQPRATDAYLIASSDLDVIRLHVGVDALSASVNGLRSPARLRPLAGIEVHPPMYPRSSLLADIAWEPTLDALRGPSLGWLLGVGVRYQAFPWLSVELAVRARQAEELGASTVMVRVNVVVLR